MMPVQKYSLPARVLHWLVAVLVIVQVVLGWAAEWERDREASFRLIQTHYQAGLLIFGLMILRLSWRIANAPPPPLIDEPPVRKHSATFTHWALYALLLTMPLSGYVIWVWMDVPMTAFGFLEVPKLFVPPAEDETWRANAWYIHFYSSWALIGLAALHIGAALWHEFAVRDGLIRSRMI